MVQLTLVTLVLVGYLIGTIPFGYIAGRLKGIDVRQFGSGGTGGTNVLRTLGPIPAALTVLADLLKGVAAVALGNSVAGPAGAAAAGIAAMAGHSWPAYLGFRGGKSVATGLGMVMFLFPLMALIAVGSFVLTVALTRFVSLGSLIGTAVVWTMVTLGPYPLAYKVLIAGAALIVYIRHSANIRRLLAGRESKFGQRVNPK